MGVNYSKGLYQKYHVDRLDGNDSPGDKHHACDLFVLDLTHDPYSLIAALAYANQCEGEYPELAIDLRAKVYPKLEKLVELDGCNCKCHGGIGAPPCGHCYKENV